MKTTHDSKQQGMSLIEILVVIILVGICSLWGMHGWQGYQQALRLEQNAQRLRLYLSGLQTQANAYNRSIILWAIDGIPGCVGYSSRPVNCTSSDRVPRFVVSEPDMEILDFTDKVMGFYGIRNAAQAGHITLRNPAGSIRLVLSARGRIRLCSEGKPMLGAPQCL
ncbi:prepilin peptidase-dependent protein [Ewingella americana]|uniref:Prepilin peptidase-dependent protein n=1 Tax=Ewingella americana TaxID=41202 RepID=A0A502GHD6_9GAMM|nr:prepilin peptidase-dependent protein [Ewingella americana]TPG60730.1 prepilin peptidase-dependent protein [Ewingella americana]